VREQPLVVVHPPIFSPALQDLRASPPRERCRNANITAQLVDYRNANDGTPRARADDGRISMPTVEERISAVEARVDAVAGLRTDMNRQFGELRTDMNRRFGEVRSDMNRLDQRVERHFMWMVGIQFSVLIAVIVALIRLSPR
jgi:hypothetical protein